ncbi:MAG: endo-1,4-beta-xylanase [Fermentimonas sp.]|nr:endo-1,4-beta-xylanase [Fermentimonas sp.]
MKHKINILGTILLFLALSFSCVDDTTQLFNVEKPESVAQKEYLNDYDVLKTYISNSAGPNFKLGAGVTASDYVSQGLTYRAINSNFDRVTAGNAMKYGSIVGDDGTMNFGPVVQFITAAKAADTEIYGHTLLWHAQQNKKYLEKIIDDREIEIDPDAKLDVVDKTTDFSTMSSFPFYVMGYEPEIIDGVLVSNFPGEWYQYFVVDGVTTDPIKEYKVTAMIRASKEGAFNVQMGNWGATTEKQISVSTDWEEQFVTFNTITTESSFVVFQPGTFDGEIEVQWVRVSHSEAPSVSFYVNQLENSEMLVGGSMDNFVVREKGKADVSGVILEGEGPDGMNAIKINSIANPENAWDTQFFIYTPDKAWEGGEKYRISFWYKASANANVESQAHGDPGAYMHYAMLPSNPQFTTEWQHYETTGSIPGEGAGMKSIAFNLNVSTDAVTYYFANIVWETEETGNKIPLTPQEKADTLTYALDQWIQGMMTAADGYVLAWDVVNEALIGEDKDGDGKYDLRSAEHASETELANDFYWGDYLGDEYVRLAVKFARQYGPAGIKLFVNDFNLESDWDDNQKLKSLIKWIEHWEEDGETVIDGIGTQMHVSYYMNPDIQASKEAHVVKMFELMAATGKLVVVTELDMGLVDENSDKVLTVNATDEQLQAMSDYYKFIVQKYLEIIPASQQAGITHWCPTDSPADSSWRGGEPVGLWTEKFSTRKHTYAGFADGLSGN